MSETMSMASSAGMSSSVVTMDTAARSNAPPVPNSAMTLSMAMPITS